MKRPPKGVATSIVLIDPKYAHNVGAAVRAASCFGAKQVWMTGSRIQEEIATLSRLPREERMKGYRDVELLHDERPFDRFEPGIVPVAVELLPNSEILIDFHHPDQAIYVFGPEDGSIPAHVRRHCHRFLAVPTAHCMNLAATVNVILYDRMMKRHHSGQEVIDFHKFLHEDRGLFADC